MTIYGNKSLRQEVPPQLITLVGGAMAFSHFKTKEARLPKYKPEVQAKLVDAHLVDPSYDGNVDNRKMTYDEYLNHIKRRRDYYDTLEFVKRDGSIRYVSEPPKFLRIFQRTFLRDQLDDENLFHSAAFAYVPGRSSVQAARLHKDATWLVKVDLKDFFHQIDERRIYWTLRKLSVDDFRSFFIARFVTRVLDEKVEWLPSKYNRYRRHGLSKKFGVVDRRLGFLPQGAPTSGAISNVVCFDLDNAISALTFAYGLNYTRYADDIVISGEKEFDREFAEKILKRVLKLVRANGFEHNLAKTRIVPPGARLKVLGVLVGGGVLRLPKDARNRIDGELRAIEKFGFKKHTKFAEEKNEFTLLNRIYGYLVWAMDVNPDWAAPRLDKLRELAELQLEIELNG